jgi:hypothetical protein
LKLLAAHGACSIQRHEQKRNGRHVYPPVHPLPGEITRSSKQHGSKQSLAARRGTRVTHRRRSPHLPRRDLPPRRRGPPPRALTPVKTRPAAPLMPCVMDSPARTAPVKSPEQTAATVAGSTGESTENSPRRPPGRVVQLDRSPAPGSALCLAGCPPARGGERSVGGGGGAEGSGSGSGSRVECRGKGNRRRDRDPIMPRCAVPPLGPVRGGDPDPFLSLQSWRSHSCLQYIVAQLDWTGLDWTGASERAACMHGWMEAPAFTTAETQRAIRILAISITTRD